jgi:hypothetical protein
VITSFRVPRALEARDEVSPVSHSRRRARQRQADLPARTRGSQTSGVKVPTPTTFRLWHRNPAGGPPTAPGEEGRIFRLLRHPRTVIQF